MPERLIGQSHPKKRLPDCPAYATQVQWSNKPGALMLFGGRFEPNHRPGALLAFQAIATVILAKSVLPQQIIQDETISETNSETLLSTIRKRDVVILTIERKKDHVCLEQPATPEPE
jgi:hypothetical protein